MAVFGAINDACIIASFNLGVVTGHHIRGRARSGHGESKEEDDGRENVGGQHCGGGSLLGEKSRWETVTVDSNE